MSLESRLLNKRDAPFYWTKAQVRFVEQNMHSMSYREIGKEIGRSESAVKKKALLLRRGVIFSYVENSPGLFRIRTAEEVANDRGGTRSDRYTALMERQWEVRYWRWAYSLNARGISGQKTLHRFEEILEDLRQEIAKYVDTSFIQYAETP